jgi:putative phosphoribosyl transferase
MLFRDRTEAGRQLAIHVAALGIGDVVVFALPRGGVPVAYEVARALRAPLDVVVVRKLVSPTQEGVSLGAVAEGGRGYVHPAAIMQEPASGAELQAIAEAEMHEVERSVGLWRGVWPPYPVEGKVALIVDEGVVTGDQARAAMLSLRARHPASVVLAVPVAATAALESLSGDIDAFICLHAFRSLLPLEEVYARSATPTDDEIVSFLQRAQAWSPSAVVSDAHPSA